MFFLIILFLFTETIAMACCGFVDLSFYVIRKDFPRLIYLIVSGIILLLFLIISFIIL